MWKCEKNAKKCESAVSGMNMQCIGLVMIP